MGVYGAPSTPSGEGVGVGHKMASVTKWEGRRRKEKEEKRGKKKKGRESTVWKSLSNSIPWPSIEGRGRKLINKGWRALGGGEGSGPGRTFVRLFGWTDGNSPLYSIGHHPLWGRCPKAEIQTSIFLPWSKLQDRISVYNITNLSTTSQIHL